MNKKIPKKKTQQLYVLYNYSNNSNKSNICNESNMLDKPNNYNISIITARQQPFVPLHDRDQRAIKGLRSDVRHCGEGEEEQNSIIPDWIRREHKSARLNSRKPYKLRLPCLAYTFSGTVFGERITVQPIGAYGDRWQTVEKTKIPARASYCSSSSEPK